MGIFMSDRMTEQEILKFMDAHLILQVLHFHTLDEQKRETLKKTSLFDQMEQSSDVVKNKEILQKQEEDLKSSINGFLNLIENFRRTGNFDASASIHKKIIDEASLNKVLEYANILYETGRYAESKIILADFCKIVGSNKKNSIKAILALWKILSINILTDNPEGITPTFREILKSVNMLNMDLTEEFKKINMETSDRLQFDFKHLLIHRGYLIHWSVFMLKFQSLENFLELNFTEELFDL